MNPLLIPLFVLLATSPACGSNGAESNADAADTDMPDAISGGSWYQPTAGTTWHWQLQGDLNTSYNVSVYDIDLEDTSEATIAALHAQGKKIICYFSAGSYEDFRDDASAFPAIVLGNPLDGFPDERWLDIRSSDVLAIMLARMDTAVTKGCDGVEPDNVAGYANDTGFALTAADQLAYNAQIANAAHARNLSVGLKNDLDQIADLIDHFDFAVNEQCHEFSECDALQPFIDANKAVFSAEYEDTYVNDASARATICQASTSQHLSTLILPSELDDSFRLSCD